MEKLNKKINIFLIIAIILSIGFPLGILGIIFGATKSLSEIILVMGILFTVAGFYVMPILWINYGELKRKRRILLLINNENIYTASSLARQLSIDEESVKNSIAYLIEKGYLTGFLFVDRERLMLNTNKKQTGETRPKIKCPNCGALMDYDEVVSVCEYCGLNIDSTKLKK